MKSAVIGSVQKRICRSETERCSKKRDFSFFSARSAMRGNAATLYERPTTMSGIAYRLSERLNTAIVPAAKVEASAVKRRSVNWFTDNAIARGNEYRKI